MLWNRRKDETGSEVAAGDGHPNEPQTLRRRKLVPELQKLADQEEFLDQLYDG